MPKSNTNKVLVRPGNGLTVGQQQLAIKLLKAGVQGNILIHGGVEYPLPQNKKEQMLLVLRLAGRKV